MFNYKIWDTQDNIYYLTSYYKPILGLLKGKVIRCFTELRTHDKNFMIESHVLYPGRILSEQNFKKAKADYLKRAEESIKYQTEEIERLKSL